MKTGEKVRVKSLEEEIKNPTYDDLKPLFVKTKSDRHNKNKDMINSPNHYIGENGIEVEDVLVGFIVRYEDAYVAHRAASAIEYILRAPGKNGLEDLKKARKNLDQAIRYEEEKDELPF